MALYCNRKVTIKLTQKDYARVQLAAQRTQRYRSTSISLFIRICIDAQLKYLTESGQLPADDGKPIFDLAAKLGPKGPTKEAGVESPTSVPKSRKRS